MSLYFEHFVKAWTVRVLEDALRLIILYAEKQMSLRSSKSDYSPKEDSAAIEATRTVKVCLSLVFAGSIFFFVL